jgi:preprotein translocase subunit SecG
MLVHLLVALLLIVVVLMQQRGGGMSSVFGGGGGVESIFGGGGAAPFMIKLTAVLATLFMITSLSLVLLSARRPRPAGMIQKSRSTQTAPPQAPQQAPASPFSGAAPESGGK